MTCAKFHFIVPPASDVRWPDCQIFALRAFSSGSGGRTRGKFDEKGTGDWGLWAIPRCRAVTSKCPHLEIHEIAGKAFNFVIVVESV